MPRALRVSEQLDLSGPPPAPLSFSFSFLWGEEWVQEWAQHPPPKPQGHCLQGKPSPDRYRQEGKTPHRTLEGQRGCSSQGRAPLWPLAPRCSHSPRGGAAYLCSSSSSSLVIIRLYWLPRSCPGLYWKKASPAETQGERPRPPQKGAEPRHSASRAACPSPSLRLPTASSRAHGHSGAPRSGNGAPTQNQTAPSSNITALPGPG